MMDTRNLMENEHYLAEYVVNEGLIISHSPDRVAGTFHRAGFEVNIKKQSKIEIEWSHQVDFEWLNSRFTSLGWYPIKMSINGRIDAPYSPDMFKKWISVPTNTYALILEPKYDVEIDPVPDTLFHITEERWVKKILAKGLIPKSLNKMTPHPERVYLGLSKTSTDSLFPRLARFSKETRFAILKIDAKSIPQYFRVFTDPNFEDGCYTLNTIPPYVITVIETLEK